MTMPPADWAAFKAAGYGDLLQCQWGKLLSTPDMPDRCGAQATAITRLYGTPEGTIDVKLCETHIERLSHETTQHAGPEDPAPPGALEPHQE